MEMTHAAILAKSKGICCNNCDGMFFRQVFVLRKVSKLVVGAPSDILIPMPMHICDTCGTPFADELDALIKMTEAEEAEPESNLLT